MSFDQGLLQVYKGRGKGKTTASFGLALRAVGQGLKVLIVQFMKSTDFITGEMVAARRLEPELKVVQFGDSKVWGLGVPKKIYDENAKQATRQGLDYVKGQIERGWDMIIMDEIGIALHLGLVDEQAVLEVIDNRPDDVELVVTGLEMADSIIKKADLVSEINDTKHPYHKGLEARKGIEY